MMGRGWIIGMIGCLATCLTLNAQTGSAPPITVSDVGMGWAGNSINAVVFRKNSLTSFGDTQFVAYYDSEGYVVLGKRNIHDTNWQIKRTNYKGNIQDAHNSISIMVDGEGYLHMAWDHHNNPLRYCRSVEPLSLELSSPIAMISSSEQNVSYPEFYKMPDGNLLFFYRDGGSGNGNLVINKYEVATKKWSRLQNNLIDGEGRRNAYWQACVDSKGAIHISWVWRETPDVASNHDLCYAVSKNGGLSWEKSNGDSYQLPINQATAEIVCAIPQNSELINQTSMCTNDAGIPYIASYWKGSGQVPQYHVVYLNGKGWKLEDLGFRKTDFSLSGSGTKKIPISRPQIICRGKGKRVKVNLVFRDEERGSKVSVASTSKLNANKWQILDLYSQPTGSWEPSYDIERWNQHRELSLFVQQVFQADAEGITKMAPQPVRVITCKW